MLRRARAASSDWAATVTRAVAEVAAVEHPDLVQALCGQLRPLGVRVGLEHAGDRLTQVHALFSLGLDYVKLDGSVVQGVAQDATRAAYVTATVSMLRGLGLLVFAEGVNDAADVASLWQSGIHGVTGPAVRLEA